MSSAAYYWRRPLADAITGSNSSWLCLNLWPSATTCCRTSAPSKRARRSLATAFPAGRIAARRHSTAIASQPICRLPTVWPQSRCDFSTSTAAWTAMRLKRRTSLPTLTCQKGQRATGVSPTPLRAEHGFIQVQMLYRHALLSRRSRQYSTKQYKVYVNQDLSQFHPNPNQQNRRDTGNKRPTWINTVMTGAWQVVAWVCVIIMFNNYFGDVASVRGSSMSSTLSPDYHETGQQEYIFLFKLGAGKIAQRGDIVAFWNPRNPEARCVKRIIAIGGDEVVISRPVKGSYKLGDRVRVPWGHVWVEGDNEKDSMDSNDFGPISRRLIVGIASRVVYPFSSWRSLTGVPFVSKTQVIEGKPEYPAELSE